MPTLLTTQTTATSTSNTTGSSMLINATDSSQSANKISSLVVDSTSSNDHDSTSMTNSNNLAQPASPTENVGKLIIYEKLLITISFSALKRANRTHLNRQVR